MAEPYLAVMTSVTEQDVEARLEEVRQRRMQHEVAITFLQKDERNLQITLETLRGFDSWAPAGATLTAGSEAEVAAQADDAQKAMDAGKPAGTPTVPDMILTIMRQHAAFAGNDGFEPKQITAQIRKRWWPEAPGANVGPVMWRLVRDGRLTKRENLYFLPEQHVREGSLWEGDASLFESSPEGEASDQSVAGPQQGPQSGLTPEGGGVGAHPEAGGTC